LGELRPEAMGASLVAEGAMVLRVWGVEELQRDV
jgi:hypothetical protein